MPDADEDASGTYEAARARVGALIAGKWRLDSLLGVGGTSAVYAGTHRNGNRAAIKVIRSSAAGNARARARLLREARTANRLASHGAVGVVDDGVEGDELFLVMELLDGETLASFARTRGGRLPVDEALRIVEGMLGVLAAAHERGIVHRDVKPENVFLTRTGGVRMLDFGLARVDEPASGADGLTRSGAVVGTPAFMAPEQARGRTREVGAPSDVWGVGATLFTVLTGRFVHAGQSSAETLFMAGSESAPPVSTFREELPGAIAAVIDRALAFHPRERFENAGAMLIALRDAHRAVERAGEERFVMLTLAPTIDERIEPAVSARGVGAGRARAFAPLALLGAAGLLTAIAAGSRRPPFEAPESRPASVVAVSPASLPEPILSSSAPSSSVEPAPIRIPAPKALRTKVARAPTPPSLAPLSSASVAPTTVSLPTEDSLLDLRK